MKKNKLKIITKILAIVIVCLVSFVGIYVQKGSSVNNIVKEYELSKDLKGYREVIFTPCTDEGANSEEVLNEENYEKVKSIIEKRLGLFKLSDYTIGLDKTNGNIYVQLPDDEKTDSVIYYGKEKYNLEIKDTESEDVLISANNIKKTSWGYLTETSGTTVYFEIELDKEGKDILNNLIEEGYGTKEEEENKASEEESTVDTEQNEEKKEENKEGTKTETEESKKEWAAYLSGEKFSETELIVENGKIKINLSASPLTSNDTINNYINYASLSSDLINLGALPIEYETSINQYVLTDITCNYLMTIIIMIAVVMTGLLIYMIVKYRIRGLLATISFIGFCAIYLLVIRYTNVVISLESFVGIAIILGINYLFNMNLLRIKPEGNKEYKKEYIQFLIKSIPTFVISIIFAFINWTALSTIGMVMFWGYIMIFIYNITITKHIVD